jgi:hypothetical protein
VTTRRDEERRRRRDRRAQLAVLVLALAAGVIAGLLGTHRAWEREPASPAPTSTTVPVDSPRGGP